MLFEQMSPLQSESVQDDPRNLSLKSSQDWVSNSWDHADIEFVVGGGSREQGGKFPGNLGTRFPQNV